jgi:hypothetical protein
MGRGKGLLNRVVLTNNGEYCSPTKFFHQFGEVVGKSFWTISLNWHTKIASEATKNVVRVFLLLLNSHFDWALHRAFHLYSNH